MADLNRQENGADRWVRAAGIDELREGMRKRLPIRGRDVTLFHVKGRYYALDSVCYRTCPRWRGISSCVIYRRRGSACRWSSRGYRKSHLRRMSVAWLLLQLGNWRLFVL